MMLGRRGGFFQPAAHITHHFLIPVSRREKTAGRAAKTRLTRKVNADSVSATCNLIEWLNPRIDAAMMRDTHTTIVISGLVLALVSVMVVVRVEDAFAP